ncbi:hypothetical protein BH09BAC1_BH09BAC1_23580 [soil metagenome]
MSTNVTNQKPEGGNSKKGIYIFLIVALILLNVFFAYRNFSMKNENTDLASFNTEMQTTLDGAEKNLEAKIQELEVLAGSNQELLSQVEVYKQELEAIREERDKLKKNANFNEGQRKKLDKRVKELEQSMIALGNTIDSLKTHNAYLSRMSDSLGTSLTASTQENELLKSDLTVKNKKVEIGSLLKPEKVTITGVRFKGNGKEVETNSAKKSEKLRFCFEVPTNQVADPGEKTLLLRVISPGGSTVAVAAEGSGMFVLAENGEQKQYTKKVSFDYDQKPKPMCVYWQQTGTYASGDYTAVFYQNGYEVASVPFALK